MIIDTAGIVTQQQLAELLGIGQPAVSQLVTAGSLPQPLVLGPALLGYCHRLREQAAGRWSAGVLDLGQERAWLARSQREAVDMKNAIARGEYAPIAYLSATLAAAASAFGERMDGLPAILRRAHPDLPHDVLASISATLAAARNAFADGVLELVTEQLLRGDFDAETDDETNEVPT